MGIQTWIENNLFISGQTQANILLTFLILFGVWLLRKAMLRLTARRALDLKAQYQWEKTIGYASLAIILLSLGSIWLGNVGDFAAYLGLITAGLAIALNGPLTDLFGWAFIIVQHPFSVGDRVQVGDNLGDVIDIRFFKFAMLEVGAWVEADQSTGRVIHVPNGMVFKKEVINFSQGLKYIWDELPVLVTFESDWSLGKQAILEIGQQYSTLSAGEAEEMKGETTGGFLINYETLAPAVFVDLRESGVLLTLRYLVEPKQRRTVREKIVEQILGLFQAEESLQFAYPTMRQVLTGRKM